MRARFLFLRAARSGVTLRRMEPPKTFHEFWSFYVLAHRDPMTRAIHTIGTLSGWTILVLAIVFRRPWFILLALVVPYALAWFSHFFVEHNTPATFGHPFWSFAADQKMVAMVLSGKMSDEVKRCATESAAPPAS
jgi:hypothetical protein